MAEEKKVTNQEYWQGFAEAPASDTFKWIDANGIEHMTTLRAWNGGNLYKAVSEFEKNITETGGRSAMPQQAPKPAQETKSASAPSGEATKVTINKIKVVPEADRIVVELYEPNHKWPDMKAFYKDAGQATAAWGMVTGLNFADAGEYQIDCVATYRLSEKLNSKGNPYKNLVSVEPAE